MWLLSQDSWSRPLERHSAFLIRFFTKEPGQRRKGVVSLHGVAPSFCLTCSIARPVVLKARPAVLVSSCFLFPMSHAPGPCLPHPGELKQTITVGVWFHSLHSCVLAFIRDVVGTWGSRTVSRVATLPCPLWGQGEDCVREMLSKKWYMLCAIS